MKHTQIEYFTDAPYTDRRNKMKDPNWPTYVDINIVLEIPAYITCE